MKKAITRISFITGVLLLLILAVIILYFFKFRAETQKMSPCPTQRLTNSLYSINDTFVNMYLVQDGDSFIAIDAGNDSAAIAKGFRQLHIDPAKVTAVLLTHTDRDHVAALNLFKNAKLRFAKEEEQMINGKTARTMGIHNTIGSLHYSLINDGETFTIGTTSIRGILTPGHTPGSMCYLINHRWLFTGDALGIHHDSIVPFNDFFNMNTMQATVSIANITLLHRVELVLTGHYGCSNLFDEMAVAWNKKQAKAARSVDRR
jgi:glyoxylase-like metal-dependent hydrolase (beta-lactamase superfamily II)